MEHEPDDPFAFEEDALAATALAVEDLFLSRDPVQEAAMYWARGDEEAAIATLERFLADNTAPKEAWWVLFDMLRARGERRRFEEAALAYALRFDCSPPALAPAEERTPAGPPLLLLPERLDAATAAALQDKALRLAKVSGSLRLDASRLRLIEPAGAALFLALLKKLADKEVRFQWRRLDLALGAIERARSVAADDRAMWELEIVWRTAAGQLDQAEALVLSFAETFEAIPPVWMSEPERVGCEMAAPQAGVERESAPARGDLVLEGDLDERSIGEAVQELLAFARDHEVIVLDCEALRRVDFVAAGMLYNAFAALKGQGKQVILRHVSQVVNALFQVLSMEQVATLQTKTY
ncbi:MAG: STAS domain-containing protein [Rhodocyclales bacterium]|nr:STAS domain-containing protein [Rhodocyclales bacterium]